MKRARGCKKVGTKKKGVFFQLEVKKEEERKRCVEGVESGRSWKKKRKCRGVTTRKLTQMVSLFVPAQSRAIHRRVGGPCRRHARVEEAVMQGVYDVGERKTIQKKTKKKKQQTIASGMNGRDTVWASSVGVAILGRSILVDWCTDVQRPTSINQRFRKEKKRGEK